MFVIIWFLMRGGGAYYSHSTNSSIWKFICYVFAEKTFANMLIFHLLFLVAHFLSIKIVSQKPRDCNAFMPSIVLSEFVSIWEKFRASPVQNRKRRANTFGDCPPWLPQSRAKQGEDTINSDVSTVHLDCWLARLALLSPGQMGSCSNSTFRILLVCMIMMLLNEHQACSSYNSPLIVR